MIHEPAYTKAPEDEEISATDPITTEDVGHEDHVEDDDVLPQIEPNLMISSPPPTSSELLSIGCPMTPRPMTPITQDMSLDDEAILHTPIAQVTTPVLETNQEVLKTLISQSLRLRRRLPSKGFAKVLGLRPPC